MLFTVSQVGGDETLSARQVLDDIAFFAGIASGDATHRLVPNFSPDVEVRLNSGGNRQFRTRVPVDGGSVVIDHNSSNRLELLGEQRHDSNSAKHVSVRLPLALSVRCRGIGLDSLAVVG